MLILSVLILQKNWVYYTSENEVVVETSAAKRPDAMYSGIATIISARIVVAATTPRTFGPLFASGRPEGQTLEQGQPP